jgi:hypothetical protein
LHTNSFVLGRCWARYRQLVPLLDRQLPADLSPDLAARFQGFAQHMLASLTAWRQAACRSYAALHTLHTFAREADQMTADGQKPPADGKQPPAVAAGPELSALLQEHLGCLDTAYNFLDQLARDYPEMSEAAAAKSMLAGCLSTASGLAEAAPAYFASGSHVTQVAGGLAALSRARDQVALCLARVGQQPVSQGLKTVLSSLDGLCVKVERWCAQTRKSWDITHASAQLSTGDFELDLHCLLFRSLLGVQEMLKSLNDVKKNDGNLEESSNSNCLLVMNQLVTRFPKLKAVGVVQAAERLAARFQLEPSGSLCAGLADSLQILATYRASLTALLATCLHFTRQFAKLLSVVLKVFHQVAIQVNSPSFISMFGDPERMFLGLPDPDTSVTGQDPDPSLFSESVERTEIMLAK